LYLFDYVQITKSITNSVNKKFKNPCNLSIYKDLYLEVELLLKLGKAEVQLFSEGIVGAILIF